MAPSLDSLPNDVQYMVFSYLSKILAGYALDGVPRTGDMLYKLMLLEPTTRQLMRTHPYQNLAATSKQLRLAVEGYCHHLLDRHKDIIGKRRIPELERENWERLASKNAFGKRKDTKVRRETYRNVWIRATNEHCVWCGKRSQRKAVFDLLVYCCYQCDERVYGRKLCKTAVFQTYRLLPIVWLRPDLVFEGHGLLPLKVSMKNVSGVIATYLLEKDVAALASFVKENDPKKDAVKRAVHKYGKSGENIIGNGNESEHIIFWIGSRPGYQTTASYEALELREDKLIESGL